MVVRSGPVRVPILKARRKATPHGPQRSVDGDFVTKHLLQSSEARLIECATLFRSVPQEKFRLGKTVRFMTWTYHIWVGRKEKKLTIGASFDYIEAGHRRQRDLIIVAAQDA